MFAIDRTAIKAKSKLLQQEELRRYAKAQTGLCLTVQQEFVKDELYYRVVAYLIDRKDVILEQLVKYYATLYDSSFMEITFEFESSESIVFRDLVGNVLANELMESGFKVATFPSSAETCVSTVYVFKRCEGLLVYFENADRNRVQRKLEVYIPLKLPGEESYTPDSTWYLVDKPR